MTNQADKMFEESLATLKSEIKQITEQLKATIAALKEIYDID